MVKRKYTHRRTPWFPKVMPPERPGVYEVKTPRHSGFSRWSGLEWMAICQAATNAAKKNTVSTWLQDDYMEWRGLTAEGLRDAEAH